MGFPARQCNFGNLAMDRNDNTHLGMSDCFKIKPE